MSWPPPLLLSGSQMRYNVFAGEQLVGVPPAKLHELN
jgi:hypothetical protein